MRPITIKQIVEITGGTLLCGNEMETINDFCIDSRKMAKDMLFVPIIGERVDGHQFIESALKNGGATLTQQHEEKEDIHPWIRVENTIEAMQKIAKWYRMQMKFPVVAITGSVGKTTTREMVTRALEAKYTVFHTEGNYNSQAGVPLTIARMTGEEEVAVLEAGMSQFGEMSALEEMIRPDIAVFTNIGVAHIENLGTQDNICKEKMELAKHITEKGAIVLNGDDPILMAHKEQLKGTIITYGTGKDCDYRATNIRIEQGKTKFTCSYQGESFEITMDVLGEHNVLNALSAFAVSGWLEIPMEQVCHQFEAFEGTRQKIYSLKDYTIIDDTYNASPDSMKASIRVLSEIPCNGRRIAVLADMLELGEKTEQYHREVGAFLAENNIEELYTYGTLSAYLLEEAKKTNSTIKGKSFMDREQLLSFLKGHIQKGDCMLLKGSNGMKLSEISKQFVG